MRVLLAFLTLALLALPVVASEPGEPTGECGEWVVHGYRVGMSLEEAKQVRRLKRKTNGWQAKETGRFKGLLQFDQNGLRRYAAKLTSGGSSAAALAETVMRQRFGDPYDTIVSEKHNPLVGMIAIRVPYWTSETCDTVIGVERVTAGDTTLRVTQPYVYLRRLSDWRKQTDSILD